MEEFSKVLYQDLQEYYDEFITFLPKLFFAILVVFIFYFIANIIRDLVNKYLKSRMDDPLLARFISRMIKALIVLASVLLGLKIIGLGSVAGSILATAGVGAFVVGFAFKDIGENLLAGIMLAFGRPFRIGDTVELDNQKGTVVALNLRDTQIKTFDGKDIFIPNGSIIKNPVVNYTIDGFLRQDFRLSLQYGSDVNEVIDTIQNILKDIDGILQIDGHKPAVYLSDLESNAYNFRVYYWLDTFHPSRNGPTIKTETIDRVNAALKSAGFSLPSNSIEIRNYDSNNNTAQS